MRRAGATRHLTGGVAGTSPTGTAGHVSALQTSAAADARAVSYLGSGPKAAGSAGQGTVGVKGVIHTAASGKIQTAKGAGIISRTGIQSVGATQSLSPKLGARPLLPPKPSISQP